MRGWRKERPRWKASELKPPPPAFSSHIYIYISLCTQLDLSDVDTSSNKGPPEAASPGIELDDVSEGSSSRRGSATTSQRLERAAIQASTLESQKKALSDEVRDWLWKLAGRVEMFIRRIT